jgi:two-component sensor histidine kinase
VTNAVKYAFPDGRPGTIRVSLEEAGGHLCLGVEDDGVGLRSGRAQGTGLGLDLVRALCQQLGGRLEVASGQVGTRLSVAFPSANRTASVDGTPAQTSMLH